MLFLQLPTLRTQEKKEEMNWEGCDSNQSEIVKDRQVRGTTYLRKRGRWSQGRTFHFICISDLSPDSALFFFFALDPWSRTILCDYPLVPISSWVSCVTRVIENVPYGNKLLQVTHGSALFFVLTYLPSPEDVGVILVLDEKGD